MGAILKRKVGFEGGYPVKPIENVLQSAEIPLTSSLYIDGHMTETPGKPNQGCWERMIENGGH